MNARLIYAASEHSANLFYATRFFAPDPFLYLQEADGGATHLCTTSLEVDRARRTARVDHVHDWADIRAQSKIIFPQRVLDETGLIVFFLKQLGIHTVDVPSSFPLGLARKLDELGIKAEPVPDPFWPQRTIKTDEEIALIEAALRITARGMNAGIQLIRQATIDSDSMLRLNGAPLTSEQVRGEINAQLVREGAMPGHTIVAGGTQGADPHEEGHGPLPAHAPIILDVFPRVMATGYWGDMTRTVCRGRAPERVRRAWEAVRQGQELAFSLIRNGVSGKNVHDAITQQFTEAGFVTGILPNGRQGGFFHGTGHGLGLEIHESPGIGNKDQTLATGHVVTVEPGLYYPDMGGVRIEDVIVVEPEGCRNLTVQEKFLELVD
ncbi:MAG: aminopeptidase P family protein [Magnetococcales bacterium]|nr:aminopeptidase P family protein [Magnetococcales bacterium]MBF0149262.1 aminopeptidase P family protein [Magnetococcales bacterium]MBF0172795.1 aminopeptidase P family protein [Magnetococcales bacterium]